MGMHNQQASTGCDFQIWKIFFLINIQVEPGQAGGDRSFGKGKNL